MSSLNRSEEVQNEHGIVLNVDDGRDVQEERLPGPDISLSIDGPPLERDTSLSLPSNAPNQETEEEKKTEESKVHPHHHHHHHRKGHGNGEKEKKGESPKREKKTKKAFVANNKPKSFYRRPCFLVLLFLALGGLGFVGWYLYMTYMTYHEGLGYGKFKFYSLPSETYSHYGKPVATWVHGNGTAHYMDNLVGGIANDDLSPLARPHVGFAALYFRPELNPPGNCVPNYLRPPKMWGNGTGPGGCWTFYSVGQPNPGVADWEKYQSLVTALAKAIDKARVVIVLEPGALCADDYLVAQNLGPATTQFGELATAVKTLKENAPNIRVYVSACSCDEGAAPISTMASRLLAAGVEQADGFALNVAQFNSTPVCTTYGSLLSTQLQGKTFILDTSRNGAPSLDSCTQDPPKVMTGLSPTTDTGNKLIDAYYWIWPPGASDGRIYKKFGFAQCLVSKDLSSSGSTTNTIACGNPQCPIGGGNITCFNGAGCWHKNS